MREHRSLNFESEGSYKVPSRIIFVHLVICTELVLYLHYKLSGNFLRKARGSIAVLFNEKKGVSLRREMIWHGHTGLALEH